MRYLLAWDVPTIRNGENQRPHLAQYLQSHEARGVIRGVDISWRCQPSYFHVNLELLDGVPFETFNQTLESQFGAKLKNVRKTTHPGKYIY